MIMVDTDPAILEFELFILKFGGIYRNFYIGITDNPVLRHNDEHNIGQSNPHFIVKVENIERARIIERYFIDHGSDGGGNGEGDKGSIYVYAYKMEIPVKVSTSYRGKVSTPFQAKVST